VGTRVEARQRDPATFIDHTPLPDTLQDFQHVDFRDWAAHRHSRGATLARTSAWIGAACVTLVISFIVGMVWEAPATPIEILRGPTGAILQSSPPSLIAMLAVIGASAVAVMIYLLYRRRQAKKQAVLVARQIDQAVTAHLRA
jgi:protein-S-isoprenylcysteine O-methyltransferase Ste14